MEVDIEDVLEESLETSKFKELELIKLKVAYKVLLEKYNKLKEDKDDIKYNE